MGGGGGSAGAGVAAPAGGGDACAHPADGALDLGRIRVECYDLQGVVSADLWVTGPYVTFFTSGFYSSTDDADDAAPAAAPAGRDTMGATAALQVTTDRCRGR